jgi:sugar phosphate isomerase/epimerase
MIRLAFSSNAFKKNSLEEAVDAIGAIGYGGVELMADRPHAYPGDMTGERRRRLRTRLGKKRGNPGGRNPAAARRRGAGAAGLAVSNVNAFTLFACGDTYHPTWIEDDAEARRRRIAHTVAAIELAAEFGAKTVSLQPGGPMIGTSLTRKIAGERFAEGLAAVLPTAREWGVVLAVEPEPGLFIQTAAEYREFKKEFFRDERMVRMNCDIGHLFCVGDDPAKVIRKMPEEIAHVHLEDIGKNRVHQHLTPGKGIIDFPKVFAALEEIGYGGWVTVELYPYETTAAGVAERAYEHLRPMIG